MDDIKIIELFFERSEQALAETKTKYGRLCEKIAYSILSNGEDAEECVSSSYMKLWNAIPPKRPESLCGYLCRIVRNTALTAFDRIRRRSFEEQYDELSEVIPDSETVESRFDSQQIGEHINAYLGKQNKAGRDIFISRYYFNMSISEIASGLGMSENAVKTRLSRTRAGLKKFLQERGVEI
ncbi:MAG: sigma-70 family RNA polymerase sigma factor [Oscillospiraceae bacterium]|nr:sigma-70 family RNA polymerase sigma factor [Oscillospiraceae bacterium]